jgi:hypothetical protein
VSSIARIEAGAEAAGRGTETTREWVLEAVREGYLMHYAEPRAFGSGAPAGGDPLDEDLKLLGGDAMYALGLARLAEEGDLAAVAVLADLISACAQAESEGRATEDLWAHAAAALGHENRTE